MLKWIKRIFLSLVIVLSVAVLLLIITGHQQVLYGIGKTYLIGKSKPDIDDLKYFDVSTIKADKPEPWAIHSKFNQQKIDTKYLGLIDSMETTAFLVIQNDSILFEQYWDGFNANTTANSFSMAKSFTAILIGIAIDEGFIQSMDQPVADFIPELISDSKRTLTIRHLLEMGSGIPYGESYNSPFGYMAKAYYGKHLIEETMKFKVEQDPGTLWKYEGGNTVLLGMIIQRSTGRTVSDYFFQKVWSCVGAENNAYWNLDKEGGMEKTFSGFYATARDFAKMGKLYLNNGINGADTIVNPQFVKACITPNMVPDEAGIPCDWYGLHWWLGKHDGKEFYSCRGMRGQYIVVIPDRNMIIVRLGHQQNKERVSHMPPDLFSYIELAKSMAQ